jgi:hypothetical protein
MKTQNKSKLAAPKQITHECLFLQKVVEEKYR